MMFERLIYSPESGHLYWRKTWEIAGTKHHDGYIQVKYDNRYYGAHILAWYLYYGVWPKCEIDHKNGVRRDNRIFNLREATHQQNAQNSKVRSHNKLGVKGVQLRNGRYRSRIIVNGKETFLGSFDTMEEASQAYQEAAKKYFGDFAHASVSSGHGKQYVE